MDQMVRAWIQIPTEAVKELIAHLANIHVR